MNMMKAVLAVLAGIGLVLSANPGFAPVAVAAETGGTHTVTVTIAQVTEDDFTSDGGEFHLNEETVVLNPLGEVASLNYFRLPCRAQVTYRTIAHTFHEAVAVKVIEVIPRPAPRLPH